MRQILSFPTACAVVATAALTLSASAQAQRPNQITAAINESQTVMVHGNVRPEVTPDNDRGMRPDSTPMAGLQLLLHRSAASQAAFETYVAGLTNPRSASYHKWLTNAQIGSLYGPSASDISKVSVWLSSQGFVVHPVSPDGTVIEFDGTAGLVRGAFKTEIHNLSVNGSDHFANVSDPQFPAALMPVVAGVASMSDFMPHPTSHLKTATVRPAGNAGGGYNYIAAADLATIYNFNPLFAAGVTGKGVTIALIEDTDQYSLGDWQVFRKVYNLSRAYPYGTLTDVHPAGSNTCGIPGANGDDGEAAIDVDWATAAAPNATLLNAACADTQQFGGFLALANLLQGATPPKVVSISYGEAESELGASENLYINTLYATAAAEGVSVFVSSGDEGAASVDANRSVATRGIAVSGFTSTPYNISVGGTDFGNIPLHSPGTYFSSTNLTGFRTALSYIPEIPWNDSCAGSLLAAYEGFSTTGPNSLCNLYTNFRTTASGSGGPSGCATGTYAAGQRYVVGGTCAGYAKPAWQSLVGVPNDGVRDIPDVSLFAANGLWGSYYSVCISDPAQGSSACSADPSTWAGYGGTSISTPIWAGIQALVNQTTSENWGNSNPVLYTLANAAYGNTGSAACNSTLGNGVSASCVFYDVTAGDMAVDCAASTAPSSLGTWSCYINGGTYGVLSTSNSALMPAYSTTVGYDFATGIGTTNATNLVHAWKTYAGSL